MSKNRALLVVVLVVACCVAGAWWQSRSPGGPPPRPQPEPHQDTSRPAQSTPAEPVGGDAEQEARVRIGDDRPDARPCLLDVRVLLAAAGGPARAEPLSFSDVALHLFDGDEPAAQPLLTLHTDGRGEARARVEGGHGRRVVARAAGGGQAEGALSADATTTLTITVTPRVIAQGRVVDAAGAGVPGADLVLLRWADAVGDDPPLVRVGRSGRDGAFRVGLAAGGRLGAMHVGHAPSAMYLVRPRRGADEPVPTQTFELTLLGQAAPLAGVVVDLDGRPVAGAHVTLRATARAVDAELSSPPRRVTSDGDGRFAIEQLPEGELAWSARAPGLGWRRGALDVRAGAPNALRITLPWPALVEGVVVTADDAPVAGAEVVAGDPRTPLHSATTSGPDGTFRLTGVGDGAVDLRASFGKAAANATLTLQAGETAQWRAVLRVGDDGPKLLGEVVDADDEPLAAWRVVVRQPGHAARGADTTADGAFAVRVGPGAPVDVRVFAPGRPLTAFADAIVQDVDPAAGRLVVRVDGAPKGSLRGRVVDSALRGCAATLGLWHAVRREYARFEAQPDGAFSIADVPPGPVDVTIEFRGHSRHEHSALVRPGAATDIGTVQLSEAGGLFGLVRSVGGAPPDACEIALLTSGEHPDRLVAQYSGGSWHLPDAPPGDHTLLVTAEGLATASFAVRVHAGRDEQYDIELSAGLRRTVRVHVPPGAGRRVRLVLRLANVPPEAPSDQRRARWFATAPVLRAAADQPGTATFTTCMPAGDYVARAWAEGELEAEAEVRYQHDGEPDLELTLRR